MSQALYRQYRPQRFEDVIGQDVAVRTLRNAIEMGRVAHAYLFTGTRGTGKTTTAKLLAKAMNCEQGPTITPCGECEECRAISEGRSINVLEIDAASNTGVDHVRTKIIDTVAFQPSGGTRRVYILDEAHMLSTAAFNALLKTIEEPPPHVLFVFCTTEGHLMPATVRDRCQRLVMKSPGSDTLVSVLERVCAKEGIDIEVSAQRAIARAAAGSFRNALGMLEMLSTTFGSTITLDDVLSHLGMVSEEILFTTADAILSSDAGRVLTIVDQLVQDGTDLDQFARALADHLRILLLEHNGVSQRASVGDAVRLAAQAQTIDEQRALAAIDCLADAATRIRIGSDERIALEAALVRACHGLGLASLSLRLAALEQSAHGNYGAPVTKAQQQDKPIAAPTMAQKPKAEAVAQIPNAEPIAQEQNPEPVPAATQKTQPLDIGRLVDFNTWWPKVVQEVAKNAAYRPMLQHLSPEQATETTLLVMQTSTVPISAKMRSALTSAAFDVTGHKLKIEVTQQVAPEVASKKSIESPKDEGIGALMDTFGAVLVTPEESSK